METFPTIEPVQLPPDLNHEIDQLRDAEARKFYVQHRRKSCTFMQTMDLWLIVPICYSCAVENSLTGNIRPYIYAGNWERAIADHAGLTVLRSTKRTMRLNPSFSYICKHCGTHLKPWNGDQMSVSQFHLEEHFNIPIETPGRRHASAWITKLVKNLYGNACFGCKRHCSSKLKLHIDHIWPQCKGGTSAFRNLQPLCERCGQEKADKGPEEVTVYSTLFFGTYPTDSHKGLLW
jgi:5-methylcytosine-specific restriction endonuclease McrA